MFKLLGVLTLPFVLSGCFLAGSEGVDLRISVVKTSVTPETPALYLNLTASDRVHLRFLVPEGASTYQVRYASTAAGVDATNFDSATLGVSGSVGASQEGDYLDVSVLGLSVGTTYYLAAKAYNSSLSSTVSSSLSVTTGFGITGAIGGRYTAWDIFPESMMAPAAMDYLSSGELLVADSGRVMKFSSTGIFLGYLQGTGGWVPAGRPMAYYTKGHLLSASGLAVDSADNIYVSDRAAKLVHKWNANGTYVGWIGHGGNGWSTANPTHPVGGVGDYLFQAPRGMREDGAGNLYIADLCSIQKWSTSGNFIGWYGGNGVTEGYFAVASGSDPVCATTAGSFNEVRDVSLDSGGDLLVANFSSIQRIAPNGSFLEWLGDNQSGWQANTTIPARGTTDGSFSYPHNLCQDTSGNYYINDSANFRIQKWSSAGVYVGYIGRNDVNGWVTGAGTNSVNPKYFASASSLYCGSSYLHVVDGGGNNSILRFSYAGVLQDALDGSAEGFVTTANIGNKGPGAQYLHYPSGVAIGPSGRIYIADMYAHRVSIRSATGASVGWIGGGSNGIQTTNTVLTGADTPRNFNSPNGIAVDSSENIYVSDSSNHRVQKWTSTGTYLGWWGKGSSTTGWHNSANAETPDFGTADEELYFPSDVAVDSSDNLYVSDRDNHRLHKWASNGTYQGWIGTGHLAGWATGGVGSAGNADGELDSPTKLTLDSTGKIFVAEDDNPRVSIYNSDGTPYGWIGDGDTTRGFHVHGSAEVATFWDDFAVIGMWNPSAVTIDGDNNLYIFDSGAQALIKYDSSHSLVGKVLRTNMDWDATDYMAPGDLAESYPCLAFNDGYIYACATRNASIVRFK